MAVRVSFSGSLFLIKACKFFGLTTNGWWVYNPNDSIIVEHGILFRKPVEHPAEIAWFDFNCDKGTVEARVFGYENLKIVKKIAEKFSEESGRDVNIRIVSEEKRYPCDISSKVCYPFGIP